MGCVELNFTLDRDIATFPQFWFPTRPESLITTLEDPADSYWFTQCGLTFNLCKTYLMHVLVDLSGTSCIIYYERLVSSQYSYSLPWEFTWILTLTWCDFKRFVKQIRYRNFYLQNYLCSVIKDSSVFLFSLLVILWTHRIKDEQTN